MGTNDVFFFCDRMLASVLKNVPSQKHTSVILENTGLSYEVVQVEQGAG